MNLLQEHINEIKKEGYTELENIISPEDLKIIQKAIESPLNKPHVNGHRGYILDGNIRYLADTLTYGKEILDFYTNPKIVEICDNYSGDNVHLSNYRIYRTLPNEKYKMPWHIDNKTDVYNEKSECFETNIVRSDKGLIVIMYLSDVDDGGFQIVKGSHLWSCKSSDPPEVFDEFEDKFKDDVITFNNRPAGTIVAYDYRCIHRAKPYKGGRVRTSLFGQYSPSRMPTGEPILLNARDINELTSIQKRVLNFGKNPSTLNWPIGDINSFGIIEVNNMSFLSKIKNRISR